MMDRGRPGTDVLIVTAAFPPERSSVSEVCWELASNLAGLGRHVSVLAPATLESAADNLPSGLSVYRSSSVAPGLSRYVRSQVALRRLVRRVHPRSILVATQVGARIVGSGWTPVRPVRLLVVGSEFRANIEDANRLRRWLKLRPYRIADGFIAISEFTKRCLVEAGIAADRVEVCYLGLNAETWGAPAQEPPESLRQLALPHHAKVVLSICRLDRRKGLDVLLRAFPLIVAHVPGAVCLLAGTGEDEPRLRSIVRECGVTDRVHFLGYVSDNDRIALLDACDVFVQPSREEGRWVEGFGLTFLEAAARGKPAIGGRHGAVPEVIVDGETGFVVDPHDPAAVAAAIVRTLTEPGLAVRLGEAGQRRVFAQFTWEQRTPVFARALGLD